MFGWIKNIFHRIMEINGSVDSYRQDSIIQSLPTVAYVNKARKHLEVGQYTEAETILKEALDISDQDARVYKYLGKIDEIRQDFEKASEFYQCSAKLNPQDKEIWLRLGMSQFYSQNYEKAYASFEKADKVTPFNTDVLTGMGMVLMKQKKYALARDKFVTATKISKYNFTAILLSAVMEIKLCDYDSAEMKLKFLTKVAPNEGCLYEYANLKLLKKDFIEAEKLAKKTLEINRQMLPAYFILGEIYSINKNLEKTEQIFKSALSNDLEDAGLYYERGKAYLRFFDFKKAEDDFSKAFNMNSEFLDNKMAYALVRALCGDFSFVDELKERHGNNVYIQEAIGLERFALGQFEDAIEMFKKALRTDKRQTYNYMHLARLYKSLGNKDKTREYFEKFITENLEYLSGIVEYAKWLIEINDFADAQRKLRRAEKLDKNNVEVLNLLFYTSYVLVKENICEYNIKEAISIAQKVQGIGNFEYENELTELENILVNIQGNN